MRKMLRLLPLLWFLLTASLVFSQVTVTTGTSNVDCNGSPLTVNEARFNWTSSVATDSMVWISQDYPCGSCSADPAVDYDRQVYNSTKVTSHCVTVNYLEPSFAAPSNLVGYDYAAGGCTDSSGGTPCSRTDPNLTFAGTGYFTTPVPAAGTFSFTPVATGPRNVYKLAGMNLLVNIIWDGGTYTQGTQFMTLTSATIDGQSCLPGALAGAACGTTGISLQMLCTGGSESINPATNNYNVSLYSVTGTYYHDYTCYNHYVGEPAVELRIVPGSTAATLMPHTISATFTLLNNSGGVIATSSPITWGFSVKATPSFTVTNPTSFPTLPNYGKYLATSAKYNTYACGVMDAGIAAGVFMNSNMSANDTTYDPWAVFNYDGNRIFKQLKDIFGSATGTWQPSTAYSVGQWVVSSGSTQVVTTAGTSGSHLPPFNPLPGYPTFDGSVGWTNGGNTTYWRNCSYNVGMQYLDWAYNIANFNTTSEWNVFPWGMYMDYLRQNDTLTENCNGSGSCIGLNQAANQRMGANILIDNPTLYNNQDFAWSYYSPQNNTIRNLPYSLNIALADWLENGTLNDPGLNEVHARVDLLLQTVDDIVTYNPLDGHAKSVYACCYSAPNFDIGLLSTSLIDYFTVNYLKNSGAVDTRIPVELLRLADWYNSYQFNLTGTDYSSTYQPWVPYTNVASVQSLGTLNLSLWSWLGAVYGNTCTLPTSGSGCWAVHDLMFQHALDNFAYYSAKQINQVMEFFPNYTGWRLGTLTGTDSYVLPAHNPLEGSYPDVLGPYNTNSYSTFNYPQATPTANGATIVWYTYEATVSTEVQVGLTQTNPTATFTCGPGTYSGLNNLWENTCTATGLNPSTTYYYSVGGTDAAGNSVQSSFASGTLIYRGTNTGASLETPANYSFTTL